MSTAFNTLPVTSAPGDLLARAIDVIELASQQIFAGQAAIGFISSTDFMALTEVEQAQARQAEDVSLQTRPALSAVNFCLRSAISLLAVANSVTDPPLHMSPEEYERAWKKLGQHAKLAGRAAYQASLILCDPSAGIVRGKPLVEPFSGTQTAAAAQQEVAKPESGRARILIVEDDNVVALLLQHTLTRLDYEVAGLAFTSSQAVELVESTRPDLVLMDINLGPGGDGIQTADRIMQELHVPVVYLTAYSEDAILRRARGTGAYGYLVKPFTERGLHAAVQMALERHRSDTVLAESEHRLQQIVDETDDGDGAGTAHARALAA